MCLRQFTAVLLLITVSFANASLTESDFPCKSDENCNVLGKKQEEGDVQYACVNNYCQYSVHVPETLHVVSTLGSKCKFDNECNIDGASCMKHVCTCNNGTISSFGRRKCIIEAEKIGDDCEEDIQCNFPQTTCRAQKCECDPGFGVNSDTYLDCRELNGIGNSCTTNEDCEVEHSRCNINQTCDCSDGYSAYKKECYEISTTFLSKCDIDFQCIKTLGPNAICIDRVCHCEAKHIFSLLKNSCIPPKKDTDENSGAFMLSAGFGLLTVMFSLAWITRT